MEEKKKTLSWHQRNEKYITLFKWALLLVACCAIISVVITDWSHTKMYIEKLFSTLAPFFVALIIAYFINPLAKRINGLIDKWIAKGKHPRRTRYESIFIAYVIVLVFVSIAINFVVPQLVSSITDLTANIPDMFQKITDFLHKINKRYPDIDFDLISKKLNNMVPNLVKYGTDLMGNIIPFVYSLSVSVVRLVINLLLSIIISIYMVSGKEGFQHQIKRLVFAIFDKEKGTAVCQTCRECNDIFSSFLIGKAVDSLIIGCLCCLIMSLLHLPYAVLLSVVVGITNMIPYFGPFIGAVPGVLIYLCVDPKLAVEFAIMILILQQFDGLVLGPRILGQSTGLSPLWVIFGITVGGAYFGVLGMFIGVPVVAVFAHLINKAIKYRLRKRKISGLE